MTHEDLMQRIRRMPYEAITKLESKDIWKLTDCFNEELVKEIVAKPRTPIGQLTAIKIMKNARIMALQALNRPVTRHPEYFEDWLFDIKTGVLVKAAPPVSNVVEYSTSPSSKSTPKVETVAMVSKVANDVADKFREYETMKVQLQQVTTENETLKKQLEACQNREPDAEVQNTSIEEMTIELFAHFCYEDEKVARDILNEIHGKEDPVIADIIYERKKRKKSRQ